MYMPRLRATIFNGRIVTSFYQILISRLESLSSRVELNARAEAGSSYAKMLLAAKSNFINVEMLIDQLKSVTTRKESLCLQRRIVAQLRNRNTYGAYDGQLSPFHA